MRFTLVYELFTSSIQLIFEFDFLIFNFSIFFAKFLHKHSILWFTLRHPNIEWRKTFHLPPENEKARSRIFRENKRFIYGRVKKFSWRHEFACEFVKHVNINKNQWESFFSERVHEIFYLIIKKCLHFNNDLFNGIFFYYMQGTLGSNWV